MHFDDRLATVLRLDARGRALAQIQYRQLLDLLGTLPADARSVTIDAAHERLATLMRKLPLADRLAALRDPALRIRSPRLVAELVAAESAMAEAAIDAARLDPAQWVDLLPVLSPAARARLGTRADLPPALVEQLVRLGVIRPGLPPAEAVASTGASEAAEPPASHSPDTIGAIVRKIEAYRKARVVAAGPAGEAPRLPLGEDHVLQVPAEARAFDFACDSVAMIVWADPGVAPMLVGRQLAGSQALTAALRGHQPIAGERIVLNGSAAIAGQWRVDASPRFDPLTGGFTGYLGRMRRWPESDQAKAAGANAEADRIRQLLHELRTPVNAIQGFAEVIQQQLFGSTPHEYRALAATIAGDAARMLAAFEDLERLAKLDSAAMDLEAGEGDAAAVFAATVAQLEAHTRQRGSGFASAGLDAPCPVPLARIELERLAWRLLATLGGTAAPGERLALERISDPAGFQLRIALPAALASKDDKALFATAPGALPQVIAAGVFGIGFALRLVRAEAKAAGGRLERDGESLILVLPGLTPAAGGHSQASW